MKLTYHLSDKPNAHLFCPIVKSHYTFITLSCHITTGKDDDIVKLYDLTSLCMEGCISVDGLEEETQNEDASNPFTVPVAMLFYRVAKNMRTSEDAQNKIATIRALLRNSLSLLNKNEYPKVSETMQIQVRVVNHSCRICVLTFYFLKFYYCILVLDLRFFFL